MLLHHCLLAAPCPEGCQGLAKDTEEFSILNTFYFLPLAYI